jgi:hypothetical protein
MLSGPDDGHRLGHISCSKHANTFGLLSNVGPGEPMKLGSDCGSSMSADAGNAYWHAQALTPRAFVISKSILPKFTFDPANRWEDTMAEFD